MRKTAEKEKFQILLLTNRDSDNMGDQVLETCDLSLIATVMDNLHIGADEYRICSRALGMVTLKYLETRDPRLLEPVEQTVAGADLLIFGGAPIFNYEYQPFYEKTALLLEMAERYGKPVIFSAIGVESYDEYNVKCQRLKKTLNFDCVKQITVRDGLDFLRKYQSDDRIAMSKVADPAVFTAKVFEKFIPAEKTAKKKVGIFVLRAKAFSDNKIDFSREDADSLWLEIADELEKRGYEYEFVTSGHFLDEMELDHILRHYDVAGERCVFNMNDPEKLVRSIASYDAVISCRLHPGVIAYSLGVPSVGLLWNAKVSSFYDSIGCADRMLRIDDALTAQKIVEKTEQAMAEGVPVDREYQMSVYRTLFYGMKNIICPDADDGPYDYAELMRSMKTFEGTSEQGREEKLRNKFRRIYRKCNMLYDEQRENRRTIRRMKAKYCGFSVSYHSGRNAEQLSWDYDETKGKMQRLNNGAIQYVLEEPVQNDGTCRLLKNGYQCPGYEFYGWKMRVRKDGLWYWYLEDGTLKEKTDYQKKRDGERYLLKDGSVLPHIPMDDAESVVLEALWRTEGKRDSGGGLGKVKKYLSGIIRGS